MGNTNLEQLAEEAFNAYGDAAGWATFDGRPMPRWDAVGAVVQSRWRAAVARVVETLGGCAVRQVYGS